MWSVRTLLGRSQLGSSSQRLPGSCFELSTAEEDGFKRAFLGCAGLCDQLLDGNPLFNAVVEEQVIGGGRGLGSD